MWLAVSKRELSFPIFRTIANLPFFTTRQFSTLKFIILRFFKIFIISSVANCVLRIWSVKAIFGKESRVYLVLDANFVSFRFNRSCDLEYAQFNCNFMWYSVPHFFFVELIESFLFHDLRIEFAKYFYFVNMTLRGKIKTFSEAN